MAKGNFRKSVALILKIEDGYQDNKLDPGNRGGGATNRGITSKTLARWRGRNVTKADVRNLSRADAVNIYKARYWIPVRGDELPAGLDLSVFDAAVNSGRTRAIKWLQGAVGAKVDGHFGPKTMAAVQQIQSVPAAIKRFNDRRLKAIRLFRGWKRYKGGWSKRVAMIRVKSLAMWLAYTMTPDAQAQVLQREADKATQRADSKSWKGWFTFVISVALGMWNWDIGAGWINWLLWAAIILVALVLASGAISNREQAKAFKEEAGKAKSK